MGRINFTTMDADQSLAMARKIKPPSGADIVTCKVCGPKAHPLANDEYMRRLVDQMSKGDAEKVAGAMFIILHHEHFSDENIAKCIRCVCSAISWDWLTKHLSPIEGLIDKLGIDELVTV